MGGRATLFLFARGCRGTPVWRMILARLICEKCSNNKNIMRDFLSGKVTQSHPYAWLWEPLEEMPGFVLRPMFGGRAAYVGEREMLLFYARGDAKWRGIYVCTGHEHHASLMAEFPELTPHSFLAKWLFLPEGSESFESVGERLVELVRQRDGRIGVLGNTRSRGKKGKRSGR